jgi:vancomycin resistance protein YoaR
MNKQFLGLLITIFVNIVFMNKNICYAQADYSVVLGEWETTYVYKGEKATRAHNIELAASKLNDVVVKPFETLSYNSVIGPRTFSKGFKKAPVIVNGELEDGYGGGVCQVSGTLHAASFFGALEIIESTQHSRTSTYISPGLDSTVAWPTKDLKIKNPYEFPIKISVRTYRDNKRGHLIIKLLGKEKVYDVEHETIVHYKSKRTTVKILLNDKPKSYRKVIEVGTPAMDITRYRKVYRYKTRNLIFVEEKRIWYDASKRIIEMGVL